MPHISRPQHEDIHAYTNACEQRVFTTDSVLHISGSDKTPNLQSHRNAAYGFREVPESISDEAFAQKIPDLYLDGLAAMIGYFQMMIASVYKGDFLYPTYRHELHSRRSDLRKGIAAGVNHEHFVVTMSKLGTDIDVDFVVRAEGALFRLLLQESDSRDRLEILMLWCWTISRLGLQNPALNIMERGHEVGEVMSRFSCNTNSSLSEYYRNHRSMTDALNRSWDAVLECVFAARSLLEPFARDVFTCQFHPPYLCPEAAFPYYQDVFSEGVRVSNAASAELNGLKKRNGDGTLFDSVTNGECAVARQASLFYNSLKADALCPAIVDSPMQCDSNNLHTSWYDSS